MDAETQQEGGVIVAQLSDGEIENLARRIVNALVADQIQSVPEFGTLIAEIGDDRWTEVMEDMMDSTDNILAGYIIHRG